MESEQTQRGVKRPSSELNDKEIDRHLEAKKMTASGVKTTNSVSKQEYSLEFPYARKLVYHKGYVTRRQPVLWENGVQVTVDNLDEYMHSQDKNSLEDNSKTRVAYSMPNDTSKYSEEQLIRWKDFDRDYTLRPDGVFCSCECKCYNCFPVCRSKCIYEDCFQIPLQWCTCIHKNGLWERRKTCDGCAMKNMLENDMYICQEYARTNGEDQGFYDEKEKKERDAKSKEEKLLERLRVESINY
jgi:hypothetical protein